MHQQALLARVEAPVGGEQEVEIAAQPRRSPVVKAHAVPSAEGRADLLLVGMDGATQYRQVLVDYPLHEPVRVGGRFDPVLQGVEPTPTY